LHFLININLFQDMLIWKIKWFKYEDFNSKKNNDKF